ncbi:MAG TPA: hypothetical protein VIQ29_04285, partial [Ancylobacter sp.]
MRVSLILEALDKASRPIRAMQNAVKGANNAAVAGAGKAALANARHERSLSKVARAQSLLARGARAAGDASQAAARRAEQGWQRALTVIGNYSRRQGELIRSGAGKMGAG